jgi:hypothetical protein
VAPKLTVYRVSFYRPPPCPGSSSAIQADSIGPSGAHRCASCNGSGAPQSARTNRHPGVGCRNPPRPALWTCDRCPGPNFSDHLRRRWRGMACRRDSRVHRFGAGRRVCYWPPRQIRLMPRRSGVRFFVDLCQRSGRSARRSLPPDYFHLPVGRHHAGCLEGVSVLAVSRRGKRSSPRLPDARTPSAWACKTRAVRSGPCA